MEITRYRVCSGSQCESYAAVATDIEKKLDLKNVRINAETGELVYENPKSCQVDEKLLEEAASSPGRNIQFEKCS